MGIIVRSDKAGDKYFDWERKIFNFVTNQVPMNSNKTFPFSNGAELHIRYLFYSPEVTSVEVEYKSNVLAPAMIFIKIMDDIYAAYPNKLSTPGNQLLINVLDMLECREHHNTEYQNMQVNEQRQKFFGWERKVFDFITVYKQENPESPMKISDGTEIYIRDLYSSPEVTSVGIHYEVNSHDSDMIFIKIKDEVYAINKNKFAPNKTFKYVLELVEYYTRKLNS
jgi:hypothetical protein